MNLNLLVSGVLVYELLVFSVLDYEFLVSSVLVYTELNVQCRQLG